MLQTLRIAPKALAEFIGSHHEEAAARVRALVKWVYGHVLVAAEDRTKWLEEFTSEIEKLGVDPEAYDLCSWVFTSSKPDAELDLNNWEDKASQLRYLTGHGLRTLFANLFRYAGRIAILDRYIAGSNARGGRRHFFELVVHLDKCEQIDIIFQELIPGPKAPCCKCDNRPCPKREPPRAPGEGAREALEGMLRQELAGVAARLGAASPPNLGLDCKQYEKFYGEGHDRYIACYADNDPTEPRWCFLLARGVVQFAEDRLESPVVDVRPEDFRRVWSNLAAA
jgi:hypothetical protein